MKIDRLIGIIFILLQEDKVTAPELAKRFEVSRRTINRDIADICKSGIPIVTTQGSGGGISILDSYKIDKAFFDEDELQAIFSGLQGIDSVSKRSYLANIAEKLSKKRNQIESNGSIMIDLSSHYQKPLVHKIELIKKAIQESKYISFLYYSEKGESARRIEPYYLIFRWSAWYALGYCLDRKDYRLFKLNRLWNMNIQSEKFVPRKIPQKELEFDDYFSTEIIHLKAIFSKSEKYRLIEEYGIDCYHVTNDGNLFFEWDFASYSYMRSWVFSFGDKVKVLEPLKLCRDRKKQAENIVQKEIEYDI
ncbi:YafY family transcriptional regulator [bacterium 1xD42-62]|uniref:YafY family transcriptional regulator n=2 Tax=Parablautia muri TaxID=2320879 RepID=A0A9X5GSI9_9FIRM|nr:YafY family transcriptional regulator [Parablautia muri]